MSIKHTRSSTDKVIQLKPEIERYLTRIQKEKREHERAQPFELEPEDLNRLFQEEAQAMGDDATRVANGQGIVAAPPKRTLRQAVTSTQRAMPMAIVLAEVAEDQYVELKSG